MIPRMGPPTENQSARRVVEEPRLSALPYAAAAIVTALAIWTIQQSSIEDSTPGDRPIKQSEQANSRGAQPAKGDLRALFSADDYPVEAQRSGEEGTVRAELTIDERGQVSRCTIMAGSGHSALDEATCRILQRRARFTPARDVNGDVVVDTLVAPPVVWRLEG